MQNEAGVVKLRRAEHASTETGGRFTHKIISSIGALQIMETHNNGKTASRAIITANWLLVNKNLHDISLSVVVELRHRLNALQMHIAEDLRRHQRFLAKSAVLRNLRRYVGTGE